MNKENLVKYVSNMKHLVSVNKSNLYKDDIDTALLYIESIEFHLKNGDQTRALRDFNNSLIYLNITLQNTVKEYFKHKCYIVSWASSLRKELKFFFPNYQLKFKCGILNDIWMATFVLSRDNITEFTLMIELDDDAFIISVKNHIDKKIPFKRIEIDPSIAWVKQTINNGMAYINKCRTSMQGNDY